MEQKYLTNGFLEMLRKASWPEENLLSCADSDIKSVQESGKRRLRRILCLESLNKWNRPIRAEKLEDSGVFQTFTDGLSGEDMASGNPAAVREDSIMIEKYDLYAIQELVMPVYICRPAKGAEAGTILYLHGHDPEGARGALWERTDKVRYHKNLPLVLARQGYRVIVPELMGFGESCYRFPAEQDKYGDCLYHCSWLNMAGLSLSGMRTYEALRVLDWIRESRPEERITVFGVSGGGQTAGYAAALDDRIDRAIVSCYVGSYDESILKKQHCFDNYLPDMFAMGDCYEIISLIAPKPLCLINGMYDRSFQIEGTRKAFTYLEKVYDRLGEASGFTGIITQGAHETDPGQVLGWLKGCC